MKMLTLLVVAVSITTQFGAAGPGPLTVQDVLAAPYAPSIEVIDTVSSLGPLAGEPQRLGLADLVRFHGHLCDGLVVAAVGIEYGLRQLFPSGIVDRTDLGVVVNGSPCYGDVAAYLTGARHRYGSLVVDPKLGDGWILRRRSTGTAVSVRLRPHIKPAELPVLEGQLKKADCPAKLITQVQQLQRSFALTVLSKPAAENFDVSTFETQKKFPGEMRPDTLKRGCPGATKENQAPNPEP